MPDIPDNVPIYVSSDYGDEEQAHGGKGTSGRSPLNREQIMNDRPAPGWAPFSPGENKAQSLSSTGRPADQANQADEADGAEPRPRAKTEEQLAQSGFQSFQIPRAENKKVFVLSPRTTMILVCVTSFNLFLVGLWIGSNFIPREPVVSSTRPGVESLFGLTRRGKGKPLSDPVNLVAEAVAKAAPAVVNIDIKFNRVRGAINNLDENGSMPSSEASGLIVRSDGYIVTNAHVVGGPSGASEIKVTLNDGKTYGARLIGVDDFSDIGVIKINADHLSVLKFAAQSDVHPGDWAIAIGSPLGFDHTVSLGVVSAVNRSLSFFNNRVSLIQHDAALNFGNSGGPLLNIRGEVIGINTAVKEKAQGIGFATPADVVADVVEQLIAHGTIPRSFLGIYMSDVDPDRSRSQTLLSHPLSVRVNGLVAEGPALKAGIISGDTIIKVKGQEVHSAREVREIIHLCKPGDIVEFVVKRNGSPCSCKVTLGDYSKLNVPH